VNSAKESYEPEYSHKTGILTPNKPPNKPAMVGVWKENHDERIALVNARLLLRDVSEIVEAQTSKPINFKTLTDYAQVDKFCTFLHAR